MTKQKGMSFVEKAGLFFGIIGVLADFTALVSFTYGFASLEQFTPSHVSSDSATSFFRWFSGLMIIYTWFITSWYLTRRTFILRYEKPRAYKNPLSSRSIRTIFGVGLFLFPTFIFWSIVNVTFPESPTAPRSLLQLVTITPTLGTPQLTETEIVTPALDLTPSPIISTTPITTETPESIGITTAEMTVVNETTTPVTISNAQPQGTGSGIDVFMFYVMGLPLILFVFGLIIYACINSLMPIIHVELLDDYE